MKKYKWHYFNNVSDLCKYEPLHRPTIYFTACGKEICKVCRHVEFKSKVDCMNCLRVLNNSKEYDEVRS